MPRRTCSPSGGWWCPRTCRRSHFAVSRGCRFMSCRAIGHALIRAISRLSSSFWPAPSWVRRSVIHARPCRLYRPSCRRRLSITMSPTRAAPARFRVPVAPAASKRVCSANSVCRMGPVCWCPVLSAAAWAATIRWSSPSGAGLKPPGPSISQKAIAPCALATPARARPCGVARSITAVFRLAPISG